MIFYLSFGTKHQKLEGNVIVLENELGELYELNPKTEKVLKIVMSSLVQDQLTPTAPAANQIPPQSDLGRAVNPASPLPSQTTPSAP